MVEDIKDTIQVAGKLPVYDNGVDVNDDGKTAYCDFCRKDQPLDGFRIAILFWQTWSSPTEYGQQCKDCQDKLTITESEMTQNDS